MGRTCAFAWCCASNHRGIPLERGSALHDPGSGWHLRCGRHTPIACHGHPGQTYCTGLTLAERLIGSIRRDCADHIIVLGEAHLRGILKSYARYYNKTRTHLALDKDAPLSRTVKRSGRILCRPVLGGLYHEYVRI
jgi:hypothetical protein